MNAALVGYQHYLEPDGTYENRPNWQLLRSDGDLLSATLTRIFFQIDALPGQSGAPLFNENHQAFGIYTYGARGADHEHVTDPEDFINLKNGATRITPSIISFYGQY